MGEKEDIEMTNPYLDDPEDSAFQIEVQKAIARLENQKKRAPKALWCECGYDGTDAAFADDGVCKCGIFKHHYHCPECGGVVQVG